MMEWEQREEDWGVQSFMSFPVWYHGALGQGPPCEQKDRRDWKHYLSATLRCGWQLKLRITFWNRRYFSVVLKMMIFCFYNANEQRKTAIYWSRLKYKYSLKRMWNNNISRNSVKVWLLYETSIWKIFNNVAMKVMSNNNKTKSENVLSILAPIPAI